MEMVPLKRWCSAIATVTLLVMLGSCAVGDAVVGGSIRAVNNLESARMQSQGEKLREQYLKQIQTLRDKGDPLGDYLWVVANVKGWPDAPILDPVKLLAMYEAAAQKGSLDAKVAAGFMYFTGSPLPYGGGAKGARLLPRDQWDMQKGLALVEEGMRERCYYWEPVLMTLYHQNCLRPINIAKKVWPEFRDGTLWPKNDALMKYWKAKRDACEQDSKYRLAHANCN